MQYLKHELILNSPSKDTAETETEVAEKSIWDQANIHCKKELAIFPSPAGMSLIKLSQDGKN